MGSSPKTGTLQKLPLQVSLLTKENHTGETDFFTESVLCITAFLL